MVNSAQIDVAAGGSNCSPETVWAPPGDGSRAQPPKTSCLRPLFVGNEILSGEGRNTGLRMLFRESAAVPIPIVIPITAVVAIPIWFEVLRLCIVWIGLRSMIRPQIACAIVGPRSCL